jgi:hypothetical protein
MPLILVILSLLAVLPVSAADPQAFAPAPLRLESSSLAQPVALDAPASVLGVRLDLPIGPIRVHYGTPMLSGAQSNAPRRLYIIDAPGAGYREQRAGAISK